MLMIDPPSGWKYGFPKPIPDFAILAIANISVNEWLVKNGYPQEEIDKFNGNVPYRYWESEDE